MKHYIAVTASEIILIFCKCCGQRRLMFKVLKSVLGFHLEWSKCQANKHHLVLWRLSPVPVNRLAIPQHPYEKTTSRTEHAAGGLVLHVRTGQYPPGSASWRESPWELSGSDHGSLQDLSCMDRIREWLYLGCNYTESTGTLGVWLAATRSPSPRVLHRIPPRCPVLARERQNGELTEMADWSDAVTLLVVGFVLKKVCERPPSPIRFRGVFVFRRDQKLPGVNGAGASERDHFTGAVCGPGRVWRH